MLLAASRALRLGIQPSSSVLSAALVIRRGGVDDSTGACRGTRKESTKFPTGAGRGQVDVVSGARQELSSVRLNVGRELVGDVCPLLGASNCPPMLSSVNSSVFSWAATVTMLGSYKNAGPSSAESKLSLRPNEDVNSSSGDHAAVPLGAVPEQQKCHGSRSTDWATATGGGAALGTTRHASDHIGSADVDLTGEGERQMSTLSMEELRDSACPEFLPQPGGQLVMGRGDATGQRSWPTKMSHPC